VYGGQILPGAGFGLDSNGGMNAQTLDVLPRLLHITRYAGGKIPHE